MATFLQLPCREKREQSHSLLADALCRRRSASSAEERADAAFWPLLPGEERE